MSYCARLEAVLLAATVIGLMIAPSCGRADDRDREIEELRSRLERLEKVIGQQGGVIPMPTTTALEPAKFQAAPPPEAAKGPAEQPKSCQEESKAAEGDPTRFEVGQNLEFKASWKDGVWFETADKAFTFHPGGRIDFDTTWYSAPHTVVNSIGQFNNYLDPNQGLQDGWDIRRFRMRLDGTMWEQFDYRIETDFADAVDLRRRTLGISPAPPATGTADDAAPVPAVRMTDVYLEWKDLPYLGTLRVGHQRECLTFTATSSENFQLFMERALLFTAFNNDYLFDTGIVLYRNYLCDRLYSWVGVFRPSDSNTNDDRDGGFSVGDGKYAYDARLTALPVWMDDGREWLMVGGAYSYRQLELDQTRFRANPLVQGAASGFLVPNVINTGTILSRDPEQYFNLQAASGWGPLSVAAEWSLVNLTNTFTSTALTIPPGPLTPAQLRAAGLTPHGNYMAQGFYVEAMYFLTGDHRTFRLNQPAYDRVTVEEKAFWVHGPLGLLFGRGAWEVGARYDYLNLSNNGINGGFANAITLGVNWHWNANMKVQWNYVWMNRNFAPTDFAGRKEGDFEGFGMRFHVDF